MKKLSTPLIGFLQALGVAIYCGLVATFFWYMEKIDIPEPNFFGVALMLLLLVVSAAITGLLVFGYPVYLTMHGKVKQALPILGYTFLYAILFFIIISLFVFI